MASQFLPIRFLMALALILVMPMMLMAQDDDGGDDGDDDGAIDGAGGVEIDAQGVLSRLLVPANSAQLNLQRVTAAKASLNKDLVVPNELRKVSLNRLEAEIKKLKAAGQRIPADMRYLAGMTRITHVFFYPETKDIVIAGPAEGFFLSAENRVVGTDSGQATLHLQDLIVALRAFSPEGNRARVISCSIDPTQQGLADLQDVVADVQRKMRPGQEGQAATAMRNALGYQTITFRGISPQTHFARVMAEADYRMKLIGIGLEEPPVGITSFIEKANPRADNRNSLQRWFFQPEYECIKVNADETAMALVNGGVKLVGANESVAQNGQRQNTRRASRASQNFCTSFTKKYNRLAEEVPLYAELRNCIDMSIVAAFIQEMDFYGQAEWTMELFGDEEQYSVEQMAAPTKVAPMVNVVRKNNSIMFPIGGGVNIQARQAVRSDTMQVDEKGLVDAAKADDKIANLAENQWWWD